MNESPSDFSYSVNACIHLNAKFISWMSGTFEKLFQLFTLKSNYKWNYCESFELKLRTKYNESNYVLKSSKIIYPSIAVYSMCVLYIQSGNIFRLTNQLYEIQHLIQIKAIIISAKNIFSLNMYSIIQWATVSHIPWYFWGFKGISPNRHEMMSDFLMKILTAIQNSWL